MISTLTVSLYQAAASAFEGLGFVLPTRELDDVQQAAEPVAAVEVSFSGCVSGALIVRISGDVLPELAANLLGQDEPPAPAVQRNALGEITTIICGNVLPALVGPRTAFQLDDPRPLVLEAAAAAFPPHATTSVQVGLDAGRADVWLVVMEPQAA
jgi:hypothetical protein